MDLEKTGNQIKTGLVSIGTIVKLVMMVAWGTLGLTITYPIYTEILSLQVSGILRITMQIMILFTEIFVFFILPYIIAFTPPKTEAINNEQI